MYAIDVANYFLARQDAEAGDLISNLKLQKLLYYAQGLHLAAKGDALFGDVIQAWKHGPVVPNVYRAFKSHGGNAIPIPQGFDVTAIPESTRDFLDEVYSVYGQFSAWKLRQMTHDEPPYVLAGENGLITNESMAEYFRQFVNRGQS